MPQQPDREIEATCYWSGFGRNVNSPRLTQRGIIASQTKRFTMSSLANLLSWHDLGLWSNSRTLLSIDGSPVVTRLRNCVRLMLISVRYQHYRYQGEATLRHALSRGMSANYYDCFLLVDPHSFFTLTQLHIYGSPSLESRQFRQ